MKDNRGFTFIELMAVVALVGIILAVGVHFYFLYKYPAPPSVEISITIVSPDGYELNLPGSMDAPAGFSPERLIIKYPNTVMEYSCKYSGTKSREDFEREKRGKK